MKFLIDANISPKIAAGLKGFGFPVTHVHWELEPPPGKDNIEDEQVWRACRENGWVLVTGDWRMHRNKTQREAMAQEKIGVFILTGRGEMSLHDLGLFLYRRLPEFIKLANKREPHYVFGVPQRGRIKRLDRTRSRRARERRRTKDR